MVFTTKNTKGKKVKIFDAAGVQISAASKYNTRTREVTFYLTGKDAGGKTRVVTKSLKKGCTFPREVVEFKVKIPGSFIIVNGKRF